MLERLTFKVGPDQGGEPLALGLRPSVTIFVGPNNSGKSKALREIRDSLISGDPYSLIIKDVERRRWSEKEARDGFVSMKADRPDHPGASDGLHYLRNEGGVAEVIEAEFVRDATASEPNASQRRRMWNNYFFEKVIMLDGQTRMNLLSPQKRRDLKHPRYPFEKLFTSDVKRAQLRDLIHRSTNLYLALDATEADDLHVRFSKTPPNDERNLSDANINFMRACLKLEDVSDGIRAFSGILLQLHVGTPEVIIVDEPEAFLHPSLAYTLGKELARGAAEENKYVFAATHSSQFLMGAIASGAAVNIVRLTYDGRVGAARLLESEELSKLMQDPLLRSTGILEGLFVDHVVVGEANADRAFYQEINSRLLNARDPRGAANTLFLNAENKTTIHRVIAPLRRLGIPAAGIVDVDAVNEGVADTLAAISVPEGERQSFQNKRASVKAALKATGKDPKRDGGISVLRGSDLEMAENLLDDFAKYGLFIVPVGELERWLPELDVARAKEKWLHQVFAAMGSDPKMPGYAVPGSNDVWQFIGRVTDWLTMPNRKGIPRSSH